MILIDFNVFIFMYYNQCKNIKYKYICAQIRFFLFFFLERFIIIEIIINLFGEIEWMFTLNPTVFSVRN